MNIRDTDMSKSNVTITGVMLRDLRKSLGLSQEALAHQADSSARYISFIETGRAHPSRQLLVRLSSELQASEQMRDELLISAGYSPEQKPVSVSEEDLVEVLSALKWQIKDTPYPAVITNRYADLIFCNQPMEHICIEMLGSTEYIQRTDANIRVLELNPELCRPLIVNLEEHESNVLNHLRRMCIIHPEDRHYHNLLQQLSSYSDKELSFLIDDSSQAMKFFPVLHMKTDRFDIKFRWFCGVIGTHPDSLCEDLQLVCALPADHSSDRIFRELPSENS